MSQASSHKAVILARGLGTRMRRLDDRAHLEPEQAAVADTGVKAMIPVGRPFLDYILSAVADAGYDRVCLVVAPEHESVRAYYQALALKRLRIEFVVQEKARGTADAVAAAELFARADPFLVINSDNYYPAEAMHRLRGAAGWGAALFERETLVAQSNLAPERVRQFAVCRLDARGRLAEILEKPTPAVLDGLPRPHWISMNCWRFGPSIFEACRQITPSSRNELELTDAVQWGIEKFGETPEVIKVSAPVLDLTSRSDIADVAARLHGVEVKP